MDKTKLAVGISVVATIIAFIAFFFHSGVPLGSIQTTTDITTSSFTSLSSANGISNGGIFVTAARNASLTAATTTPCAIQGPNATSSVSSASLLLTVSSTTASTVTVATAASAFATTTFLMSQAISANALATVFAVATSSNNWVVGPSQWVVFGMAGGVGTFSPTGVCEATFQVLN